MKLALLCVGKLKEEPERAIVARYLERVGQIGAAFGLSCSGVIELPESRASAPQARKSAEAAELKKRLPGGTRVLPGSTRVVALDERGRAITSQEFAGQLRQWQDEGSRDAIFIIGGPDGIDPHLVKDADLALSLGRITLPHGLARAVLAEQLYRAATLIAGHPYHRA